MSKKHFSILLDKYVAGTLTPEEKQELVFLLHSSGADQHDLETLIDETFSDTSFRQRPSSETSALIFRKILIAKENAEKELLDITPVYQLAQLKKRRTWLYAASAILLLGAGIAFLFNVPADKNRLAIIENSAALQKVIAPPAIVKAMIRLANGRQILLDSAENGMLAMQGNASVMKMADGEIVYSHANKITGGKEIVYNTLTVPRGSKVVSITLADKTKVWLNAASSLKYPVAFIGRDRKVEVTGEVYFEVAKDEAKKFIVEANAISTEVLGTHFNINAYTDEPLTAITLLEGAIKITKGNSTQLLAPGQKAQINAAGSIAVDNTPDIEQVMAWKNGRFLFGGANINEVMRQITRWYDVEIVYEGGDIHQHFRGGISRDVEASKVFKMLEATEAVHFKITGKTITVTP